jgi:trimethylamine--corrinoid protein Co-methyltransferase
MIRTTRPKVELLSRSFIEKIVDEAFLLLERHGVFVENAEARSLFKEAGMPVDERNLRVLINRKLIEDSLASTPLTVKLYDRAGRKEFVVGHDNVHFDPGSAAVKILDHSTQQERKPETADLVRLARLTESCEHIHFQSTALVSSDVPPIIADSYRLYLGLQFSSKPVVTGTFRPEGFRPMFEMLAAVRGGDEELRRKPLAIFDACPSPPLKWSNLTTQSLIDCARAGIPENLAGLVICQLAQHGAPVIFGGSPASFDMRKGTTPMGAIETMMIDMAYAQIGKYLKLPTHAYMGLSDAKINDAQAGLESGMGATLAALAGINVISGAGMLNFESTQSLEKLLVDNEICGMAYRLIEGIAQREDPLALRLFEGFKPETQFMTMPHTRKWYRLEHTFPRLADRDTYDAWVSQGRKSMDDRAHDRVEQILDETPPNLADEALRKELERIMRRDAKNNGYDRLPDIL